MAVLEMEIQARVYDGLVLWCQRGSSEMMRGLVCEVAWLQIKAGGHVIVALPASRRLLRQVIAEHPWMGRLVCGGLLATAGGRPRKEEVERRKKRKVSRVHSQSGHNSIDLQPDPDKHIVSEQRCFNKHKLDFIVNEDSWRIDNLNSVGNRGSDLCMIPTSPLVQAHLLLHGDGGGRTLEELLTSGDSWGHTRWEEALRACGCFRGHGGPGSRGGCSRR
jgi:hypothetical protein